MRQDDEPYLYEYLLRAGKPESGGDDGGDSGDGGDGGGEPRLFSA